MREYALREPSPDGSWLEHGVELAGSARSSAAVTWPDVGFEAREAGDVQDDYDLFKPTGKDSFFFLGMPAAVSAPRRF